MLLIRVELELYVEHTMAMGASNDPNGFFFATKMMVMRESQVLGECVNKERKCSSDFECNQSLDGKCQDGLCFERGWCPLAAEEDIYYLNPNAFRVWFKGTTTFPTLSPATI